MSISPWTIYFWQLADEIKPWIGGIGIATGALSLIVLLIRSIALSENAMEEATAEKVAAWLKFLFPLAFVLTIGAALVPTSRTIAMMVVIPAIVDSKAVQQDLPEIYDLAVKALKEQLGAKK